MDNINNFVDVKRAIEAARLDATAISARPLTATNSAPREPERAVKERLTSLEDKLEGLSSYATHRLDHLQELVSSLILQIG